MSRAIITAAAAMSMTSVAAHAVIIYGMNHLTGSQTTADTLVMFDSSNPSGYTVIGSTGHADVAFGGLSFDGQGNLWGYASFSHFTGGDRSGLYRIDLATGAATLQGTRSNQSLEDLAYNPVDGRMYGINTRGRDTSTLYTVDLATGSVSEVGQLNGLPASHALTGLAIDSAGNFYVQDLTSRMIYGGAGTEMSALYSIELALTGSQGIEIDWSRDDAGYHAAIAQGDFPNYISQLNMFATDGSGYVFGDVFGPNGPDGLPALQLGDLAIMPIPAPGTAAVMLGGAMLLHRRR